VDTGVGATLREARTRRKVDLSEVEAAIKIRLRYLRAMENEDWDVLPGGAYTRGFIRTYASYLGLDGERLAEEYRRAAEPAGGERAPKRVEPVPTGARRPRRRLPGGVAIAFVALALIALVVAIGLVSGGGGGGGGAPSSRLGHGNERKKAKKTTSTAAKPGIELRLAATGEVWVCVLDGAEKPLVAGEILEAGEEAGPYRSKGFTMAFGNGAVELKIDGKPVSTPPSNSPVAYEVGAEGKLKPLEEGERPTCE
jgi:Helix-turn-helix domain/RodZ C-terminal domain